MSCAQYGWVRKQRGLSHVQRLVLAELVMRANGDGFCFPSIALLARDVEATERAVIMAIKHLTVVRKPALVEKVTDPAERAALLEQGGARDGTRANVYRILYREGELSSLAKGEASSAILADTELRILKPVHPELSSLNSAHHEGEASSPATLYSVPPDPELSIPEESKEESKEEYRKKESVRRAYARASVSEKDSAQIPVEEESRPTTARAGRPKSSRQPLPADWRPDENSVSYAIEHGVDPNKANEEFRNYWLSTRRPMADWQATFRNRVLVLEDAGRFRYRSPALPTPPPPRPDPMMGMSVFGYVAGR